MPDNYVFHKNINKLYKDRYETIKKGTGIGWESGEQLAYATLLDEGYTIRLSGEDVQRGTFSHRHAVIYDQNTKTPYTPVRQCLKPEHGDPNHRLHFCNSFLSEYGVLGYEYGYSLGSPQCLTIWEAQFGDFANVAQATIDNFIVSGERKWGVKSGLVLQLPHGYDGAGPEHSSSRLERFLQLMDDDPHSRIHDEGDEGALKSAYRANMTVINVTTPANFFHALRRQLHRNFRKPLIVMSPKKLLRHKLVKSNIEEFEFNRFKKTWPEAYPEKLVAPEKIRRIINCSGQVYFDLLEHREKNNIKDVVIHRIEQVAPFPYVSCKRVWDDYPNADIVWAQEEHRNQGAWTYMKSRMQYLLAERGTTLKYRGRAISGSTAVGSLGRHKQELEQLVTEAFDTK